MNGEFLIEPADKGNKRNYEEFFITTTNKNVCISCNDCKFYCP